MTDQTRKEFEEWLWHTWPEPDMAAHKGKEFLFMVWQASRQAIEVELPTVCASDDPFELKRDIICEIEAIGLKVKP